MFDNIKRIADALEPELKALSLAIHDHPELGEEEYFACEQHCNLLEKHGFEVEKEFLGLPTAFKATYRSTKPGPTVAYLAEYDALPGIGHGCGHSILGAVSTGAGIVVSKIIEEIGGTVEVYGTPAEETNGNKALMADRGAFNHIDAAMMTHPSQQYGASGGSNGIVPLRFEYFGKTAHAAGCPELGINALHAVISLFNNISSLREHFQPDARVHGVIKDGGKAANIVPDYAMAEFYVRAEKKSYLNKLVDQVKGCAEAAALSNGAKVKITNFEACYDPMVTNETLSSQFTENLLAVGVPHVNPAENTRGSTDAGNVSQCCPMIHGHFGISETGSLVGHSVEFTEAAGSDYAHEQMMLNVRALAMTAYQVITNPELLAAIKAEFEASKADR